MKRANTCIFQQQKLAITTKDERSTGIKMTKFMVPYMYQGGVKNAKIGIFKKFKQIPNSVTALTSEQLTKLLSDEYPCAKSGKQFLQRA